MSVMSIQITKSEFLRELSLEEQQFISGGQDSYEDKDDYKEDDYKDDYKGDKQDRRRRYRCCYYSWRPCKKY